MRLRHALSGAALVVAAGCAAQSSRHAALSDVLGLDVYLPRPEDNPLTAEKVDLGRRLFFDARLSADGRVSCSSCHLPAHAFADTVATSRGVYGRRSRRNAPTLVNRGYGRTFFWDGRAASLEDQVVHPIQDSLEMAMSADDVVSMLRSTHEYTRAFRVAFGHEADTRTLTQAVASFVRAIRSGNAPIDRWRNGDTTALSAEARRGLDLFYGRAQCSSCHVGPNFTDELFHNTGHFVRSGDRGRAAITGRAEETGAFKTPTLRDVAMTAPYMHDGGMRTLEDVIEFYDRGGLASPYLDPNIKPLHLPAREKRDLVAFLRSLTGDDYYALRR